MPTMMLSKYNEKWHWDDCKEADWNAIEERIRIGNPDVKDIVPDPPLTDMCPVCCKYLFEKEESENL